MSGNRVKLDLVKLIQQAVPQLPDEEDRALLSRWLAQQAGQERIVEIDLEAVQPEPGEDEFCLRCGYQTIVVKGDQAYCRTCGFSWVVKE